MVLMPWRACASPDHVELDLVVEQLRRPGSARSNACTLDLLAPALDEFAVQIDHRKIVEARQALACLLHQISEALPPC